MDVPMQGEKRLVAVDHTPNRDRADGYHVGFASAGLNAKVRAEPRRRVDTGIDSAPRLSSDLRVQTRGGEPDMIPVGSVAVRSVIDRYQPLLALHGHIHES